MIMSSPLIQQELINPYLQSFPVSNVENIVFTRYVQNYLEVVYLKNYFDYPILSNETGFTIYIPKEYFVKDLELILAKELSNQYLAARVFEMLQYPLPDDFIKTPRHDTHEYFEYAKTFLRQKQLVSRFKLFAHNYLLKNDADFTEVLELKLLNNKAFVRYQTKQYLQKCVTLDAVKISKISAMNKGIRLNTIGNFDKFSIDYWDVFNNGKFTGYCYANSSGYHFIESLNSSQTDLIGSEDAYTSLQKSTINVF